MKKATTIIATLLLVMAFASLSRAESSQGWDPTDKDQVLFTLQSRIMTIDHAQNRLVVAEREIELFNEREKGRELTTMLRSANGRKIEWKSLQRGDLVFVRGFEQSGAPALAREIYLLPAGSRATDLPFEKTVPEWNWTKIEDK